MENKMSVAHSYISAGVVMFIVLGLLKDIYSLPVEFDFIYQIVILAGFLFGFVAGYLYWSSGYFNKDGWTDLIFCPSLFLFLL